jgi:hypothetical protein
LHLHSRPIATQSGPAGSKERRSQRFPRHYCHKPGSVRASLADTNQNVRL